MGYLRFCCEVSFFSQAFLLLKTEQQTAAVTRAYFLKYFIDKYVCVCIIALYDYWKVILEVLFNQNFYYF